MCPHQPHRPTERSIMVRRLRRKTLRVHVSGTSRHVPSKVFAQIFQELATAVVREVNIKENVGTQTYTETKSLQGNYANYDMFLA